MDPVLARPIPAERVDARARSATRRSTWLRARLFPLSIAAGSLLVLALLAVIEMRTSSLQARLFSVLHRGEKVLI